MDMLTIRCEHGTATDQAPQDGERRFQDRQAERYNRNGDGNDGRSLLGSGQGQRAQQEADEQTARIAKKDGGGVEVVAQKAKDRPGQSNRHHRDERVSAEQRDYELDQRRKQGRTCSQTIQAVNQVERVGDGQDPQNGERQTNEPRQFVLTEQDGDIQNAQAANEEQSGCERLNSELDVGADRVKVVVDAEKKNDRRRHQNREHSLQR